MTVERCSACDTGPAAKHHACRDGQTWCAGDRHNNVAPHLVAPAQRFGGSRACGSCGERLKWDPWMPTGLASPRTAVAGLLALFGTLLFSGLAWLVLEPQPPRPLAIATTAVPSDASLLANAKPLSAQSGVEQPGPSAMLLADQPLGPRLPDPYDEGIACFNLAQWECAIDRLEVATYGPPSPALTSLLGQAHYRLGLQHIGGNAFPEGLRNLDAALALTPDFADARIQRRLADLYSRGLEQLGSGNWADAANFFQQVADVDAVYKSARASLAVARIELGRQLEAQGLVRDAIDQYHQALVADPGNSQAERALLQARMLTPSSTEPTAANQTTVSGRAAPAVSAARPAATATPPAQTGRSSNSPPVTASADRQAAPRLQSSGLGVSVRIPGIADVTLGVPTGERERSR